MIIGFLKGREGAVQKVAMFLSKFVFVWVIDLLFGDNINMYGFFGILAAVAGVTIVHKLTDSTFKKLGE